MAQSATHVRIDPALRRFSRRLVEEVNASQVLLFGPHATGTNDADSAYDVIVVSEEFSGVDPFHRGLNLKLLFHELGGRTPMYLHCITPEEFETGKNRITMLADVLPEAIDLLAHYEG